MYSNVQLLIRKGSVSVGQVTLGVLHSACTERESLMFFQFLKALSSTSQSPKARGALVPSPGIPEKVTCTAALPPTQSLAQFVSQFVPYFWGV